MWVAIGIFVGLAICALGALMGVIWFAIPAAIIAVVLIGIFASGRAAGEARPPEPGGFTAEETEGTPQRVHGHAHEGQANMGA
jgi:hypothetical protein